MTHKRRISFLSSVSVKSTLTKRQNVQEKEGESLTNACSYNGFSNKEQREENGLSSFQGLRSVGSTVDWSTEGVETSEYGEGGTPELGNYEQALAESIHRYMKIVELLQPVGPKYREGREKELATLMGFITSFLDCQHGGGVCISGRAGVGKTLVATEVAKTLHKSRADLTEKHVYIDCCNKGSNVEIFIELMTKLYESEGIVSKVRDLKSDYKKGGLDEVVKRFTDTLKKRKKLTICIVDDVDLLEPPRLGKDNTLKRGHRKSSNILQYLFKAALNKESRIVVIGICDSTELVANLNVPKIAFAPYDEMDLNAIINKQLENVAGHEKVYEEMALRCTARKVANDMDGDCRKLNDCLCRQAQKVLASLREKQRVSQGEDISHSNSVRKDEPSVCGIGSTNLNTYTLSQSLQRKGTTPGTPEKKVKLHIHQMQPPQRPVDAYDLDPLKLAEIEKAPKAFVAQFVRGDVLSNAKATVCYKQPSSDAQYTPISTCSKSTAETLNASPDTPSLLFLNETEKILMDNKFFSAPLNETPVNAEASTDGQKVAGEAMQKFVPESNEERQFENEVITHRASDGGTDGEKKRALSGGDPQYSPIDVGKFYCSKSSQSMDVGYSETPAQRALSSRVSSHCSKSKLPEMGYMDKPRSFGTVLNCGNVWRQRSRSNESQRLNQSSDVETSESYLMQRIGVGDLNASLQYLEPSDTQTLVANINSLTLLQKLHLLALCSAVTEKRANIENLHANSHALEKVEIKLEDISRAHEKLLEGSDCCHLVKNSLEGSNFQSALTEFANRGFCKVVMGGGSSQRRSSQGGATPRKNMVSFHSFQNLSVVCLLPHYLVHFAIGTITYSLENINIGDHFNCGLEL